MACWHIPATGARASASTEDNFARSGATAAAGPEEEHTTTAINNDGSNENPFDIDFDKVTQHVNNTKKWESVNVCIIIWEREFDISWVYFFSILYIYIYNLRVTNFFNIYSW